jgi:predicted GIY-YIG superfamily endonuclease
MLSLRGRRGKIQAPMPRKQRFYYVYILSSVTGTLYTGITNSIYNRTLQHKGKDTPGFTSKYEVDRLVYYEVFTNVRAANSSGKRNQRLDSQKEDCSDRVCESEEARSG